MCPAYRFSDPPSSRSAAVTLGGSFTSSLKVSLQDKPLPSHTSHASNRALVQHRPPASSVTSSPPRQHLPCRLTVLPLPSHTPQASSTPLAQHRPFTSLTGVAPPALDASQQSPSELSTPDSQHSPSASSSPEQEVGVLQNGSLKPAEGHRKPDKTDKDKDKSGGV